MKKGLEVDEGKKNYNISNINRKRKVDYTWTGRFMCSSEKIRTLAEKQVLQKASLGLKKIKFSVEDDEVAAYNQLTGTVESDETAGYSQLKNCGGFVQYKKDPYLLFPESLKPLPTHPQC